MDIEKVQQGEGKKMVVDKYDRQIRLWGPRGQRSLANARVALIHCTGAGIEALKNLILPGVGHIDIWDNQKIKIQDLSSSFFYQQTDVGKFRGEIASKNLLQMNQDSKGQYINKSVDEFLGDQNAIKGYSLVIFGGEISEEQTIKASQIMWKLNVPCIFITIAGFFFYVRLQKQTHFVQSSNTSAKKYNLRLSDPFPELLQHAQHNSIYKALESQQGKNVQQFRQQFIKGNQIPSILILVSAINKLPLQKRKRNFIVQQLQNLYKKANYNYRDNIKQAMKNVMFATQTPDNFMIDIGLLTNKSVVQCQNNSHIMLKFLWATNTFYQQNKKLPQSTLLPDMSTTTQRYIKLRKIYKDKHESDVKKLVQIIKGKFGDLKIDEQLISQYVNNLSNLQVVQMRPYFQELQKPNADSLTNYYQNQKDLLISIRSYQKLFKSPEQAHGSISYQQLKNVADILQKQYGTQNFDQRYLKQVARCKGWSNINIYSIAGAMTGQESIKLITGCFAPMSGGYIFDGANAVGYQIKL